MTTFTTIPMATASDAQLLQFAEMIGADIDSADGRTAFISKIHMIAPGIDAIRLPEVASAPQGGSAPEAPMDFGDDPKATALGAVRMHTSFPDPRVILQIDNEERDGQTYSQDVNVGVNGKVFQLKRGTPLDVPARVWIALNNARRNVITHDSEGNVQESSALSYPFTVIEPASQADLREWHEQTKEIEMA